MNSNTLTAGRNIDIIAEDADGSLAFIQGDVEGQGKSGGRQNSDQGGDGQHGHGRRRAQGCVPLDAPPDLPRTADRPGQDDLVGQEAAQVIGELLHGRVSGIRILFQRPQADHGQIPRHPGVDLPGIPWIVHDDLLQHLL